MSSEPELKADFAIEVYAIGPNEWYQITRALNDAKIYFEDEAATFNVYPADSEKALKIINALGFETNCDEGGWR